LDGKVAAVIGGARDLGFDMAEIFAEAGCDVAITSRKVENAEEAAAKVGVLGLTRDLAGLLSPLGVHVNAISPGGFGPRQLPSGFVKDYSDRTPLGRMGRDGVDLKGAALFLASPASDYVTGHNLVVDGGFSIWH
jgi:NAD(P)-dependent dehydrogenase (short-subunit alcohol dehydrogenase family)